MMRALAMAVATAACAALTGSALAASPVRVAPDSPGCVVRSAPPKVGVSELSRTQVDDRLLELRLHSDAMQGTQPVSVLLPKGYDASGRTHYPVLYLLHGAFGKYTDWISNGAARDIV